MASMTWTPSQEDAISARRGTVLVAAAAGSGKTAVLVQRAVERLTDPEHPTPADRMLIVTFTKAAAQEMRSRLEKRLYELLAQDPTNGPLRKQSILLSQAHIGTVDSFCAEMVREFFHLLHLSPDFTILSEKQRDELRTQAISEALAQGFEDGSLQTLADAFAGERDDSRLAEMALKLHEYMQSHPFPNQWLEEKVKLYFTELPPEETPWGKALLAHCLTTCNHCIRVADLALAEAKEVPALEKAFVPALESDRQLCVAAREQGEQNSWDGLVEVLSHLAFARRGIVRNQEEEARKEKLELLRGEIKGAMTELSKLFSTPAKEVTQELRETGPLVESLARLTLDFGRRFEEKKRAQDFLDYSDLEHFAISLFLHPDGTPTPTAKEVSARFDEIMIDEFQDINEVQNSLFRGVSRGGENLFMVGDVKQSIYGFRQAMPEIFLGFRRAFAKYHREREQYPATLTLDRNFRSRRQVTESVNFIFSRLMSPQAGGMAYAGEEMLVYGAQYPEKAGCETKLLLLEREGDTDMAEAEAVAIAGEIRALLDKGFTVSQGQEERPARYADFCVLLRSANQYAFRYAKVLTGLGIPARAQVTGGFFTAPEISLTLSFLQVVDNPNQDIPLLAVMMSPVYGFTEDMLAALRLKNRQCSLYFALQEGADGEQESNREACQSLLEDLTYYRMVSATMPCDAFLDLLYGKTALPEVVSAMENGEERLGNLRQLRAYAQEYGANGYHGVSGFVGFLGRLRENKGDLPSAEVAAEGANAVSILSVHKSKGLEFPVCFVAGCGRNFIPERGEVLLHPELGLGVKLRDKVLPARFTTVAREAIALETQRASAAEELRVLYVALTRAREKLILVGAGAGLDKLLTRLSAQVTEEGISPYGVLSARNTLSWLLLCALSHPDGGELREVAGIQGEPVVFRDCYTPWEVEVRLALPREEEKQEEKAPLCAPDPAVYQLLRERSAFHYPHSAALAVPAKVAASKLAAKQTAGVRPTLSRPAWLGEQGLTPAQRGIALHDFMAYGDFARALADPGEELERLTRLSYLSPEQAQAVDLSRVKKFLLGPLGQRVLASQVVEKERRFTVFLPACLVEESLADCGEERVVLQGAVDCTFLEQDKLHIIDFKTDHVKSVEELWFHYGVQIRLYGYAMEQVTGKPVGDLILYSTFLNEGTARPYERPESL